ncbi:hypothetical protein APY03_1249 [Variovorax sp. WDL1]|nr:hypothetical protein APY03_1249 [Variovorax sp. WDL1]
MDASLLRPFESPTVPAFQNEGLETPGAAAARRRRCNFSTQGILPGKKHITA